MAQERWVKDRRLDGYWLLSIHFFSGIRCVTSRKVIHTISDVHNKRKPPCIFGKEAPWNSFETQVSSIRAIAYLLYAWYELCSQTVCPQRQSTDSNALGHPPVAHALRNFLPGRPICAVQSSLYRSRPRWAFFRWAVKESRPSPCISRTTHSQNLLTLHVRVIHGSVMSEHAGFFVDSGTRVCGSLLKLDVHGSAQALAVAEDGPTHLMYHKYAFVRTRRSCLIPRRTYVLDVECHSSDNGRQRVPGKKTARNRERNERGVKLKVSENVWSRNKRKLNRQFGAFRELNLKKMFEFLFFLIILESLIYEIS